MTASIAYDPKRLTGYQLDQLAGAFDRVRNARDWKAPIDATIAAAERPLVEKAVLWFTDTVPRFSTIADAPDRLAVRALGYRLGETETRHGHLREDSRQVMASMEPAGPVVASRGPALVVSAPARPRRRFAPADPAEFAASVS
jgi:hypothetical protein